MKGDSPVRDCDVCGKQDTTARHIHDFGNGQSQTRHIACCATAGCPSNTCTTDKEN